MAAKLEVRGDYLYLERENAQGQREAWAIWGVDLGVSGDPSDVPGRFYSEQTAGAVRFIYVDYYGHRRAITLANQATSTRPDKYLAVDPAAWLWQAMGGAKWGINHLDHADVHYLDWSDHQDVAASAWSDHHDTSHSDTWPHSNWSDHQDHAD